MRDFLTRRQTETAVAAFVAIVAGIVGVAANEGDVTGPKYLALERLGRFDEPTHLTQPPGMDSDLFVVEKPGMIRQLTDDGAADAPFLDIRPLVKDTGKGGEQGMLSAAFSPDYADSGLFYVAYTDRRDALRVVEYSRDPDDARRADPDSARTVMVIPQPTPKHHGGLLLFGPDGHLYIGSGDGGPSGDPNNNAQNKNVLLGKILRIDPRPNPNAPKPKPAKDGQKGKGKKGKGAGKPRGKKPRKPPPPSSYTIPSDNPFVGKRGRDEIWAYGLRNPWRFSFDRATGTIAIADVGDTQFEEVNYLPAPKARGANFGWNVFEGQVLRTGQVNQANTVAPVLVYGHGRRNCAVTGGYIVRDGRLSRIRGREIVGRYIYGDYCAGKLFAFRPRLGKGAGRRRSFKFKVPFLSSFGEDNAGRIYVLSQFSESGSGKQARGAVYRLDAKRK